MIRVDTSATIDRPVEDVARYLADIERMTEWTDMTASRRLTEGPTTDGTKAYAEVAMGPVKLGWTYEIRDFHPHGVSPSPPSRGTPSGWTAASA
jgi:hypothetical protein